MSTTAITITGSGKIVAVVDGKPYSVDTDHNKYDQILETVREQNWERFVKLADVSSALKQYVSGEVEIKDGVVLYKGEPVHNSLTNRIINFASESLPFEPLVKFFDNLMLNPSYRAVKELYNFLEVGELPITLDGCFLAYKNVRDTYYDIHSGTYRNMIGDKPYMQRNLVDEDKNKTCSKGLHFCSIAYLPKFKYADGGHTMILKINPKDVVSIPADHNDTKGRCCEYEVVAEYFEDWRSKIENNESGWESFLYNEDGNKYEEGDNGAMIDEFGDIVCTDTPPVPFQEPASTFYNQRDSMGRFVKKS